MTSISPDGSQRRILELLKAAGTLSATELAHRLEITDVAVRQHLAVLEAGQLVRVAETEAPQGRGRPARRWSLTGEGHGEFPDRNSELALGLISAIRSALGEEGLRQVVEVRAGEQIIEYSRHVPRDAPLSDRIDALAQRRTADGYMADVQLQPDGSFLLIEHHCPICDAARSCQGLCAAELEMIRDVLGPDVTVERTEHLLAGGQRCVYRVSAHS